MRACTVLAKPIETELTSSALPASGEGRRTSGQGGRLHTPPDPIRVFLKGTKIKGS